MGLGGDNITTKKDKKKRKCWHHQEVAVRKQSAKGGVKYRFEKENED